MFKFIIETAVRFRWAVVFVATIITAYGLFELTKLPIDAVPDITNRQVQINTIAPALAPGQIERQVTYPLETALAGTPGLTSTRSISRNGFSQITAIFTDQTDIYFARQQVGERMREVREDLPEGVTPMMSPVTTGLASFDVDGRFHAVRSRERRSAERTGLASQRGLSDTRRRPAHDTGGACHLPAHRAGLDHCAADALGPRACGR